MAIMNALSEDLPETSRCLQAAAIRALDGRHETIEGVKQDSLMLVGSSKWCRSLTFTALVKAKSANVVLTNL